MTKISEWTIIPIPIPKETAIYKWFTSIGCKFIISEYDSIMKKTYFHFLPKHKWNKVTNLFDYMLIHSPSECVSLDGKIEDWKQADLDFFEKYSGKTFYFPYDGKSVLVPDILEVVIISTL